MQMLDEVPEGFGADAEVRIRKVPVQRVGEVLQGFNYPVRYLLDVLPAAPGKKVKKL